LIIGNYFQDKDNRFVLAKQVRITGMISVLRESRYGLCRIHGITAWNKSTDPLNEGTVPVPLTAPVLCDTTELPSHELSHPGEAKAEGGGAPVNVQDF